MGSMKGNADPVRADRVPWRFAMAEVPAVTRPESDDYEYDEAHDADGRAQHTPAAPPVRMPDGIHVGDTGGDYGYDCAHDRS